MRKLALAAFVALFTLVPAGAVAAKSKVEAFTSKHRLTGSWKTKDADKDGLKNFQEYKLGTNPRKADSDRDGLKDGDEVRSGNDPLDADTDGDGVKDGKEHAGVVTAFDGETITIREFATGKRLSATLDTECTPADEDEGDDEEPIGWFQVDEDEEDDESCTDDDELDTGVVLQSAELEDGVLLDYVIA